MFQFNVEGLFVGGNSPYSPSFESIATHFLEGVQAANIALDLPRLDELYWDGAGDRQFVERPRAILSFSYYPASGINEQYLGFFPSATVSALTTLNEERNYYLQISEDHIDLTSYSGRNSKIFALGNGVITSYQFSAGVGQVSTVSASVECLNALIQPSGTGQPLPAIYKQVPSGATGLYSLPFAASTISNYRGDTPQNIIIAFDSGSAIGAMLSGNLAAPVQSFSFNVAIPRANPKELGWAFPNTRPIQWPVSISIHADAYLNGIQLDALNRFNCPDSGFTFSVGFKNSCTTSDAFAYRFTDAKLDQQTITAQIGGSTKVSLDWSLKIMDPARSGNAPNFYIAPGNRFCYSSGIFPQVNYVTGSGALALTFGSCCFLNIIGGAALLNANNVIMSDDPTTVTLRVSESGTNNYQDVTITVS